MPAASRGADAPCGGAKTDAGMNIAGAISMPAILWSVDTLDWKTRDASRRSRPCLRR